MGKKVNNCKNLFILISAILLFVLIYSGCSGSDTTRITNSPLPTATPEGIYPDSSQILSYYFNDALVGQMRSDAAPFVAQYEGVNIFSTAHYGRVFITGQVTIKDVFDARLPQNYEIFKKYAFDNFGIKAAFYERYAEAANQFIEEFGYDVVLLNPDELHPVHSNQFDTWMLIRDKPTNVFDVYYSTRVINRAISLVGGLKMRALTSGDAYYTPNWMYYIPQDGAQYVPYTTDTSVITISEIESPTEKLTFGVSNYVPEDATDLQIAKRRTYGIVDSNLSNKTIRVGGWKNEAYSNSIIQFGVSFRNNPNSMSWGGWGLYLLPLESEFWVKP